MALKRHASVLGLAFLGGLAFTQPVLADTKPVEVRILERRVTRQVEAFSPEGATMSGGRLVSGRMKLEAKGSQLRLNGNIVLGGRLEIGRPVESNVVELRWPGGSRKYPGRIVVRAENGKLVLVNVLPLETYVAGVVSAEMPEAWPVAAKRAQAVVARTLALKGGDHPGGRLCDLTHCQAYAGERRPEDIQVALETRGRVLTHQGQLIHPLYHSTCGGERASNAVVFGGTLLPYLQEGTDPYCEKSPQAAPWSVRVLASELAKALNLPQVKSVQVVSRSEGGWVAQVSVNDRLFPGYRFWQALGRELGWGVLKSMRYTVRKDGGAFVFEGRGLGHGVGMCQWGARGQAEKGIPYARILESYYPGTSLVRR